MFPTLELSIPPPCLGSLARGRRRVPKQDPLPLQGAFSVCGPGSSPRRPQEAEEGLQGMVPGELQGSSPQGLGTCLHTAYGGEVQVRKMPAVW